VASKFQALHVLVSDDGIDLILGFRGVLLRVGFCFNVALGSELVLF